MARKSKERIEKRFESGYIGNRKIRSDANRNVDGIITSDNEFFQDMDSNQIKRYFQDSLEFLENEYGKDRTCYGSLISPIKRPANLNQQSIQD